MAQNIMQVTFKANTTVLDLLDKNAPKITDRAVREVLEKVKDTIRDNWSAESPSSPGNPPAVVTGYLDQSLKVQRRDILGRFSTPGNTTSWSLKVNAEYGAALEFGRPEINLAPRPFLRPAIKGVEKALGDRIKIGFRFVGGVG